MSGSRNAVRFSIGILAGVLLALVRVSTAGAGASVGPEPPIIVAHPDNVMVNSSTTLTGIGFPRDTTLALRECGATHWAVFVHACDTNNGVTVSTNDAGTFTASFKVELCPRLPTTTPPPPPVTSETCYIGVPRPSGVDTVTLIGAAKITVTYP